MRNIILLVLVASTSLSGQDQIARDWNAFGQNVDMAPYRGGQFRLRGFVKVENGSKLNNARLWARVDLKKGVGFFDNMHVRPITEEVWREYLIEGGISKKAMKLVVGGLYFGTGKYYFDDLSLEVKGPGKEWEKIALKNGDFEQEFEQGWKTFFKPEGFQFSFAKNEVNNGKQCFLIDGSTRKPKGSFVQVNGVNLYYESSGAGDTVLLLHGNSMSTESFYKQIPELSKQFHVIAMDSRGQGNSSNNGSKISYELMAEDVNQFIERLGLGAVNILGWSDGGNIGLILAMNHPDKVKRLATMGANLFNDETSVEAKINRELRKQRERYVSKGAESNKFQIEMIELLLNEPKINPDELTKIKCKSLIMAGSRDVIKQGHTRLIASKITNSKLLLFPKGTHYEPWENPERFNAAVVDFFKQN